MENRIYAIVLTYDDNVIYTDNLLHAISDQWQRSNFIFRIPYNNKKPLFLKEKHPELTIEFIKTPKPIKKTVLQLISDLDGDDWIYWCIDDKFPLDINQEKVDKIFQWIANSSDDEISGVSFSRARLLRNEPENYLNFDNKFQIESDITLIERTNCHPQFWTHQFFRVKVLKLVFNSFPDIDFQAKLMDIYIKNVENKKGMKYYVTEKNHVVFSESATRGKATLGLKKSLKKHSIPNYADKEFINHEIIIGFIPSFKCLLYHLSMYKDRFVNKIFA